MPPNCGGINLKNLFVLSAFITVCGTFAAAQQTCTATTASVIGTYTYTATEFPFGTVAVTPPGTTTNSQPFSNTQIGNLIQSLTGGGPFATANVFYFDGAGNISISLSPTAFMGTTPVGTYTVNSDCTINVTLTDTQNTTAVGTGVPATQGKVTLIGVVLGGGAEVYLSAPQSATSTNGNTPLAVGQFASRLSIPLIRTFAYGCSVASLTGSYGLIGNGFVTEGTNTMQAANFIGVVTFDGGGHLLPQIVGSSSPLGNFQFSGNYTVNLNCTGSMTLTPVAATAGSGTTTTTTTTTASQTVSFVLTPPITYPTTSAYSAGTGGNTARPGLQFSLTNSAETLFGFGIAQ
jgi:hypothetical protein